MFTKFDDWLWQYAPMPSGAIRPGKENIYDAPLAPSKFLLDDINHIVVEWKGFLEPVDFGDCNYNYELCEREQRTSCDYAKTYFAESSSDKYIESHHVT
ncbi:MAG: hypothetical protein KAS04_04585 [Candidatus Aenigmarchaeota archaeon]|nr:hypothetical protein [Candidatus Aenigmarchaeota archaeon]